MSAPVKIINMFCEYEGRLSFLIFYRIIRYATELFGPPNYSHPLPSFSCKSFKESPLGAELAFFTQRASFFNKIESNKKVSRTKFSKFSTCSPLQSKTQFSDWFNPTLKTNKFRLVGHFSFHEWDCVLTQSLTLWSRTQNYALSRAGQKNCPGRSYYFP